MTEPERNGPAVHRGGEPRHPDPPAATDFYDAELRAHNGRLRSASDVCPGDRVLDVGCGAGQSTRDAAQAAAPGGVLGVDLSEGMLERARALTASAHLDNVTYQHGDAQVHPFASTHFDLVISRFGTMFFSDPVAAFTNIAGALRPDARLVMLVWQGRERNEWAAAIDATLRASERVSKSRTTLDPFSLADKSATSAILGRAGFHSIGFSDVHEPVFFGHDSAAAFEHVHAFQDTRDALASMSSNDADDARERLRDTLETHYSSGAGVVFESRAWLITAHRTVTIRPATTERSTS